ncbi:unnamed protein product [Thlaspi arvense]|uniref:Myb/SANT-like domain-containing protein n=1 Tax=Thlaspi arvense TaxID=13288 RepID=A0AAU9RT60_THLAR|nr:unnamed protein product [Thlaspi arvense]
MLANTRSNDANNGRSNAGGSRSKRKDKSTDEPKYIWNSRYTESFLELVNNELKAKGYVIRLPDNPGKRRVEEKFYEMTGVKLSWEPEMKSRINYMRKLWHHYSILVNRTRVSADSTIGKINMSEGWWNDIIAEFGNNGKFVRVLQSKPLPFKELLDQIYSKHDVEQDDRYSPHTLRTHLQQTLDEGASDDDIGVDETAEDNTTQTPLDLTSEDEFPRAGQSPTPTTRERVRSSPSRTNKSSLRVRKVTTTHTNRRRIHFETQVQAGFQRLEESRTGLLDVLRLQHNPKATFGDALVVLESLTVEPMGKFWWAANKLLLNDEDARDGFVKLRSEDNKIQFLEKLTGIDRYGLPCDIINLKGPNSFTTPYVPATHSQMAGTDTNASSSFGARYGLFETSSSGTSFSTLLGLRFYMFLTLLYELRIAELHLRGIENLSNEEIAELILLEEAEILETHISPVMEYYGKYFYKKPMSKDTGKGWRIIQDQIYDNEASYETEAGTYMRIVRDKIFEDMWLDSQRSFRYQR